MADTTRNIFTLGEYRDDQTAGKGVPVTDVWTDLFPTGAVEINTNTQDENRMNLGWGNQGSFIYIKQSQASTPDWNLGTGDWSFECWCKAKSIYTSSHYKRIWELGQSVSDSICVNVKMNGTLEFRYNDTVYLTSSSGAFTIGEWHHVLVHKVSGVIRLFLDGVRQQSASNSTNFNYQYGSGTGQLRIGANHGSSQTSWWNGWISNFRFLKGSASHTSSSDFVPPKPPLQNITNTKVLCCQDSENAAGWTVIPTDHNGDQKIYLYGLAQSGNNASSVGTQQASLQYVGLSKRWLGDKTETSNMGYVFGGSTPSAFSNMMRLDMSTNTTSFFPGSENSYSSRWNHAATASQTTGYVAGGEPSTNAVGQFNFSNETSSGSSPMTLVGSRRDASGNGNVNKGYITGGGPGNPGYTNTTKLDYAANTSSNLPSTANLRSAAPSDKYTKGLNNTGNQEIGYTIGGNPGSSYIDRFTYATETMSSTVSTVIPAGSPSNIRKPSYAAKGTSLADGTYGYMIGNNYMNDPSNSIVGSWFRITFATDTEDFMPSWYPSGASGGGKFGNTTKGYTMGGGDNSQRSNRVLEFNYATGTGTGVPGSVPASINQTTGMSVRNSNAPIYFPPTITTTPSVKLVDADYGIYQARDKSTFDKRDFSTDGVSLIPGLAFPGGNPGTAAAVANQEAIWTYQSPSRGGYKIPWASQTRITQPNSWFPMDHWYHLGEGSDAFNSSTSGYFAGGNSGTFNPAGNYAYTSEVFKVDFSTGTGYTPGSNRGERNSYAGNGQSDIEGYSFGGENNPSPGSHNKVYRMKFSNEGWDEIPGTGFPSNQSKQNSVTGNKTHLYVGGGRNPSQSYSYIWKMSINTNTGSSIPARLPASWPAGTWAWGGITATGDQEKGYWGGGGPSEGGNGKLVYATDTVSGTGQYNNRMARSYAISNVEMNRSGKIGSPIYMQ